MATVGINFGAANSGKGFDVASTVTAILAAQRSVEDPWKSQLTSLTAQDTALSTIGTDLASLSTALGKLTDFTGVTAQKEGSSSDTSQLELTGATSAASAGSHTVVVSRLATTSSSYSDAVTAADVLSGSITIQVGSGTAHTVTVNSTSNTLSTLKAAINAAAIGVSASIVTDTNGSRLSLVSNTGGTAGSLTITSNLTDTTHLTDPNNTGTPGPTVINVTTAAGTNGSITVDSVPVSVSSNTVSTAIPGVTFQLLAANTTPIQIQITNDTSSVATAFSNLVTAYNTVAKDLSTQEGKDASGNPEPLYGSQTLALIQNQLSSGILAGTASGSISNLSQLGISFNNDGTLALNTDTLTTALTNNFSDIVGYLQNPTGFGISFNTTLNNLSSTSTTGAIKVALTQNSTQETRLNQNVTDQEAKLADQQTTLTAQLNTANQVLQAIPDQLDQINQLYSAITGYNTKG